MLATKVQILPLRRPSPPLSGTNSSPHDSHTSSTESGQESVKQKRASKPKVRSGCVTCKIRRVKCDETKPACDRCTSTGRTCDGYAIKPRKKRTTPNPRKNLKLAENVNHQELRALEFFQKNTAPALSSYFDAEFWGRLVFQMSYTEPAILHAMVALGALHEQHEQGLSRISFAVDHAKFSAIYVNDSKEQFALAQYGRALSHLSDRLNSSASTEVALLACILFICVEFFRGDVEPAVRHFRSGMAIAMSSLSNDRGRPATSTLRTIKEHLLPFLNRIELLSTLQGEESPYQYPVELFEAVPDEFESIKEARDSLIHLANLTVRYTKAIKQRRYNRVILPDDIARRAAVMRQLDNWIMAFDRMLLSVTAKEKDSDAVKTLRIHQIITGAWLDRCIYPEETANDISVEDFDSVVSLAESIQKIPGSFDVSEPPHFLFDMEIVSPIYYIAIKCRHPVIRRRAINLLKRMQRREGLWESNNVAAIAERLMMHEEASLTVLDGSQLPPEKDRIHHVRIHLEVGSISKRSVLTMSSLPDGINGPWKIWSEEVVLP